jgi:hypothetical protein
MTSVSDSYIQLAVTSCFALILVGMYTSSGGEKGSQF